MLWTDRNGRETWWTPLEDNPAEENFKVPRCALRRIEEIVARGCLPDPKLVVLYAPEARPWQELEPVRRLPNTSQWYFLNLILILSLLQSKFMIFFFQEIPDSCCKCSSPHPRQTTFGLPEKVSAMHGDEQLST